MKLDPRTTTVITMECQRGVIGDMATFPQLKSEVDEAGLIGRLSDVVSEARSAGCTVCHALAHFREDRAGSRTNAPLLRAAARIEGQLLVGSPQAELVPELGPDPADLISTRLHGVSPFGGTDLDEKLRAVETKTVVAVGVSLNVGVMGLVIEAVNHGYDVVLVTDAVVAVPNDIAPTLLRSSFAQLATLVSSEELLGSLTS